MPDPTHKNPLNVPGSYYNDLNCIDCDLCHGIAPDTFRRDDDEGMYFVWRQPVTPEEIAKAEKARDTCPMEAIGREG